MRLRRSAQADGLLTDSIAALDLFYLLIAMASTWAQASIVITASPDDPEQDHDRRRRALGETVRRAFCR